SKLRLRRADPEHLVGGRRRARVDGQHRRRAADVRRVLQSQQVSVSNAGRRAAPVRARLRGARPGGAVLMRARTMSLGVAVSLLTCGACVRWGTAPDELADDGSTNTTDQPPIETDTGEDTTDTGEEFPRSEERRVGDEGGTW